jgi:hypothetical protein
MSSKLFCKYVLYSETNITLNLNDVQKFKKLQTSCILKFLDIKLLCYLRSILLSSYRYKVERGINILTPELNPSTQRCLTRFYTGNLLLEPCILLIYAWETNNCNNYSFSLLIMYCSSYMFRHYFGIFRERSQCLLRDAKLRSSR